MSSSSNTIWKIVGGIAGVLIVGALIGWLAGGGTTKTRNLPPPVDTASTTPIPPSPLPATPPHNPAGEASTLPVEVTAPAVATNSATNAVVAEWEEKIDEILRSTVEDTQKSAQLLALYPKLPPEGQTEATGHLVNLMPDDQFSKLGQILADPKTSESVQEVIMFDLLNRPNAIKLPLLLEMARNPQHAMTTESRELLELYVEEDFGEDWAAWQVATTKYLKENPD